MADRFTEWAPAAFSAKDPEAFAADVAPCESCGGPCSSRTWNAEHELWIGVDCSCSIPDEPLCPELYDVLMASETVGELHDHAAEHIRACARCKAQRRPGPLKYRKVA